MAKLDFLKNNGKGEQGLAGFIPDVTQMDEDELLDAASQVAGFKSIGLSGALKYLSKQSTEGKFKNALQQDYTSAEIENNSNIQRHIRNLRLHGAGRVIAGGVGASAGAMLTPVSGPFGVGAIAAGFAGDMAATAAYDECIEEDPIADSISIHDAIMAASQNGYTLDDTGMMTLLASKASVETLKTIEAELVNIDPELAETAKSNGTTVLQVALEDYMQRLAEGEDVSHHALYWVMHSQEVSENIAVEIEDESPSELLARKYLTLVKSGKLSLQDVAIPENVDMVLNAEAIMAEDKVVYQQGNILRRHGVVHNAGDVPNSPSQVRAAQAVLARSVRGGAMNAYVAA